MKSVFFQGKPLIITIIQVSALTGKAEEAEVEQFNEDLQPSRTNTQKRCPFHYRGLECKSRKSRNTWSNSQIWPWSTEWSRAKANRVLPRERTGHSEHPLPTMQEMTLHMDITRWLTPKSDWLYSLQPKMEKLYTFSKTKTGNWLCQENALAIANCLFQQHKRTLYTWTSRDGQHGNQIDCILCSRRWRSSIQSAKTRLGAVCDSDHELLIAKFRVKLKNIGKSTRPFSYDK